MKKRILSLILVLLMIVSLFPSASFAEEPEENDLINEPYDDTAEDVPNGHEEAPSIQPEDLLQDDNGDDPEALLPEGDEIQTVASGECGDNLTWTLDENGLLTISGTGDMWDWGAHSGAPWYDLRESITGLELSERLTRIGKFAFNECKKIPSVSIPQGVTVIDEYAFRYCNSMISVDIPDSVTTIGQCAFVSCESLPSVVIPEHVTNIGAYAFCNCNNLSEVIFEGNAPSFGSSTFYGVTAIAYYPWDDSSWTESIMQNYGGSITWIPRGSPCGNELYWIIDGSGVLIISGTGEMWDWSRESRPPWYNFRTIVTELCLSEDLTYIGKYAFSDCSGIQSVSIPTSVTGIGDNAFNCCWSLTSVTIPSSITSIGKTAFVLCDAIEAVYIDDLVWWLNLVDSTASDLPHGDLYVNGVLLENAVIPEGITVLNTAVFRYCKSLKSISLPESLVRIDSRAFEGCSSLTLVAIPASVTSINDSVFLSCDSLVSITIPNSITTIPSSAFWDCKCLEEITIPESVTSIGSYAFRGCSGLRTISFLGDAPQISSTAFSSYTPIGSGSATQVVCAMALYPIDNDTWSTDKLVNYGAESLTWVGYREEAKAYSVHYDPNGGFGGPGDEIKGHSVDLTLSNITPLRYNESVVLTVNLDPVGGSIDNTTLTAKSTSTFSFNNWNTTSDGTGDAFSSGAVFSLNSDTTLFAQWDASTSTASVTLPTPSREGYDFMGWADSLNASSGITGRYTPEADVTLYAIWEAHTYTVSYDANGGEGAPESQTKTYGIVLALSSQQPIRADMPAGSFIVTLDPQGGNCTAETLAAERATSYTFTAWNTATDGSGDSYAPGASYTANASVTLYAQWDSSTSTEAVDLPTPTREGYLFKGWAVNTSALSGITGSYTPTENITLYAIWERVLPTTGARFTVGSGRMTPGNEIRIPIHIENNPGVVSIEITVAYDESVLEWTGVEEGEYGGLFDGLPGEALTWFAEDPAVNETEDGVFCTLIFRVKDDAPLGTSQVTVRYDEDYVYNADEENQAFTVVPGEIEIISYIPGDINGDGKVNNKDVTRLQKYLKHGEAEVVEAALDVNGDGKVNNKDATRLQRYLKHGDVEIH